jgi:zinc D-Ala-D-Ala carboxypeptidase
MKLPVVTILLIFASVCHSQQTVSKDFLMGRILNSSLKKDANLSFQAMKQAVWNEKKIVITIKSGTRNYIDQKGIWEAKWCGKRYLDTGTKEYFAKSNIGFCKIVPNELSDSNRKIDKRVLFSNDTEKAKIILKYSSMPGTSRHHWGTDIDINNVNPNYWEVDKGKELYEWLKENAKSRFKFCQVYSEKSLRGKIGYEQEKWHWSYMPLAKGYLAEFKNKVIADDVKNLGFLGGDVASSLMDEYISSINPDCNNL